MLNKEITDAIATLQEYSRRIEDEYENNGGEVTDETVRLEAEKDALAVLLTTDGVDSLGRWLKEKEDKVKTIKAEADYIARQRKGVESDIDYIKGRIAEVLTATGTDYIKGASGYSFTLSQSVTTAVDKAALVEHYQAIAEKALRDAGIPEWITVKLDASVSNVPEGEPLPDVFIRTAKDTVTFRKPKASKEE